MLFTSLKYKLKANHNSPDSALEKSKMLFTSLKYKLKANHNKKMKYYYLILNVIHLAKIQTESESQR